MSNNYKTYHSRNLVYTGKTPTEKIIDTYMPCGKSGEIYCKRINHLLQEQIQLELNYRINKMKLEKQFKNILERKKLWDKILYEKEREEKSLKT